MWYIIWRNQKGKVMGFIIDDNGNPFEFKTEKDAENHMRGHILEPYSEIIKL